MNIGMSIKHIALRESIPYKEKQVYLAGFPSLEAYIDFLQSLGVSSIEVRIYHQTSSFEDYQAALSMIQRKGLHITLHGELSNTVVASHIDADYPSLPPILNQLNQPIVMPIHASQGVSDDVDFSARTANILQTWGNELHERKHQLQFALENNRVKKVIDPGNTIQGVLTIIENLNREDVGICWDMGHYYSNVLNGKEIAPPQFETDSLLNTFCKHVVHTHIHGINEEQTTHFPIRSEQDLPLQSFVQLLEQKHYKGIYNLELSLERWSEKDDPKQLIAETIQYLQDVITTARKELDK